MINLNLDVISSSIEQNVHMQEIFDHYRQFLELGIISYDEEAYTAALRVIYTPTELDYILQDSYNFRKQVQKTTWKQKWAAQS